MIDMEPSPKVYMRMLEVIINDSPIEEDVSWAKEELKKWKDYELIKKYGKENVEDFRMWQTHARMPGDTLSPYEWDQLSIEDKKNITREIHD